MTTWSKLTNPPIVEGLIDLHLKGPVQVEMDALKAMADRYAGEYPSREPLSHWTAQIHITPEAQPTSTTTQEPSGWRLRSVNDKWVVQLRRDALTVSRLEPYKAWEDLLAKTQEWWIRHREVSGSNPVTRVASRFINRVPLPQGEPFETTFRTMFALGPNIPTVIRDYFLRVTIPFQQAGATAVVTQFLEPPQGDACILDIDVFVDRPEGVSDTETWQLLEALHRIKNELFFNSLTTTALQRFQ